MLLDRCSKITKCAFVLYKGVILMSCAFFILLPGVHTLHYIYGDIFVEILLTNPDFETVCVLWGISAICVGTTIFCYFALRGYLYTANLFDPVEAPTRRYVVAMLTFSLGTASIEILEGRLATDIIVKSHLLPFLLNSFVLGWFLVVDLGRFYEEDSIIRLRRLEAVDDDSYCPRRQIG